MKKIFVLLALFNMQIICFAEPVNKDWLQKDITIIETVLNFIDKKEYSNSNILQLMNKNLESEDLGFDLQKSKSAFYGGYLSIYFSYLSYKDLPCELRIYISEKALSKIKNELPSRQIKKLNKKFVPENNCYIFSIKNDDNYQVYYDHKYGRTENSIKVTLSSPYQEYYDFLTSPFNGFSYGYILGEAAEIPDARIAMEKLMELNNKDIFINIIKSDNPAGRMYGMEGLLRLDNSSTNMDIVNGVFKELIKDKIRYKAHYGCIIVNELYEIINSENFSKYIYDFHFEYYR